MRMKLVGALRELWRDRRGNMLMIFAFSILPITFATGMGIDYAGAMRIQTRLNAVADAASLAAVTAPMMRDTADDACVAARATFESQASNIKGLSINTATASGLTIVITDTYQSATPQSVTCPAKGKPVVSTALPLTRTTQVTYRAQSLNNFARVLGRQSLGIGGTTTAKTIVAPFIDIHMALDTSQSMGLAATDADAISLWNLTRAENGSNNGCTFGCHVFAKADNGAPNNALDRRYSNEKMATDNGIKLRIDVLRTATQDMIQSALDSEDGGKYYRFALYRIGAETTDIAPLSGNLGTIKSTVEALQLGPSDAGGPGDTDLADMLDTSYAKITAKGDGTSQEKARAFLFIVTDGLYDIVGPGCPGNKKHCTGPIPFDQCQRYKDAGITVGVVYTTFLPIRADPTLQPGQNGYATLRPEYNTHVKPYADQIAPNLQKCASPGWYFEASDGPSIHSSMQNLFRQATQMPTIIR